MKKRNIPFGYQYQNGVITAHPQEVAVLNRIFSEYQNGMSLLDIANRLNDENVEYQPDVTGWNKSRIMRLIEDERYTGKNDFPAIIDEKTHRAMVEMKAQKNTQHGTDRSAEVFHIDLPIICPECGGEMVRRHDSRFKKCPQKWICSNPECLTAIHKADSDLLNDTEHKKTYVVTAENDVVRGGLSVEKRDSITGSTPQGNADFSGITFEIINDSRNPVIVNDKSIGHGEVALTLTTDSEGKASTAAGALPYGSYVLHESATNESMLNTAPDQPVEVTENGEVYPFFMDNEVVRGGVLIEKRDLESLLLTPLGGASLDGTLFEITNKSRNPVYVNGALYQPDEVCLTIEVKDGVAQSDVRALPYGSYELAESKPGTGYLWTDKTIRPFDVLIDGSVKEYREGDAAYNQVKRGDLKFVKVGEKNMHRFANVAFKLTSQTTGESHILVTDANGEVRTETKWNPHTQNTNGNDDKPEAEWDDETGTWFGQTTEDWMVETQDGLCALPYDYYTLQELRCEGNKGYALVTVPNIFISRDSTVIELGTIDDHEEGTPEIGTTAMVDSEKTAEPLSEITLVDTVRYSGLTVGKTYKLSGVLMDKAAGEPLTVDGKQVTAEKEFTPKSESGTEELSYTFSASALAGKSVVVFEDLYEGENKVASHADIEDEGQTITFTEPKIGTTATVGGEHTAEAVGEITIVDTVKYSGLIPGKEYTVNGVLMDKATGNPLMVADKEITAEATFRASKAEGTMTFPLPLMPLLWQASRSLLLKPCTVTSWRSVSMPILRIRTRP